LEKISPHQAGLSYNLLVFKVDLALDSGFAVFVRINKFYKSSTLQFLNENPKTPNKIQIRLRTKLQEVSVAHV